MGSHSPNARMIAGRFAPSFLAQVPTTQIDAIVKQYTAALGPFQRADATSDGFTLVIEHGAAPAKIHLDAEGRIDGLWFGPPQSTKPMSLEDGKHYCVAATWNNRAALDQSKFFMTYGSILSTLAIASAK